MTNITQEKKIYGIIYCITNIITQKMYIGQTIKKLKTRWSQHISKSNKKPTTHMQHSINKHGIENFKIEEIDYAYSKDELNEKEIDWIYILNTLSPNGYNLSIGGENQHGRISEHGRKYYSNPETKEIIYRFPNEIIPDGFIMGGKIHSEETKNKMSQSRKGIIFSSDHCNNLSKSLKGRDAWNKGQILTDEQKKNMFGPKERKTSEETKIKLSKINKEKIHIFNPITGERRSIHYLMDIPEGFIRGRGKTKSQKRKDNSQYIGRKWFHNDILRKNIWVFPENKPDGFEEGMRKYNN